MDDLSVCASVRTCVGRSVQCIVENGGSDPDAVWHHRSDGSRDESGSGVLLGANLGRNIVTNGDFTA